MKAYLFPAEYSRIVMFVCWLVGQVFGLSFDQLVQYSQHAQLKDSSKRGSVYKDMPKLILAILNFLKSKYFRYRVHFFLDFSNF